MLKVWCSYLNHYFSTSKAGPYSVFQTYCTVKSILITNFVFVCTKRMWQWLYETQ